jgi:myo-inositol-1(or 4)-monophosphatase
MHPMLNTAIKAARAAGRIIVRHLADLDRLAVESKGRNDFVTQVDRRAEEEILRVVQRAYPDHAILAEESGVQAGSEYEWIIDPLDGTTNFLHGYPQFAVSIAAHQRGRPMIAVVFDPLREELFTATRGDGAQLNDRRIRVSHVNQLDGALLGTGFPYSSMEFLDAWIATFRELVARTSGVRRAGSAALDLAHVACGRLDGFWEFGLSPWDIAAGCLLIEEAGGLVSDFAGGANFFAGGNVLCGNPRIHAEMLRLLPPLLPDALKM